MYFSSCYFVSASAARLTDGTAAASITSAAVINVTALINIRFIYPLIKMTSFHFEFSSLK